MIVNDLPKTENKFPLEAKRLADFKKLVKTIPPKSKAAPLPLQKEVPCAKPYPFDLLGAILGPAALCIHEIVKAPDAICGQSVLAAAALVTQAYADISIDGRTHPLSLFALTVAESGDRKSAVDTIALQPVREFEKMLSKECARDKKIYKNKLDVWKKKRSELMNEYKGDELENHLNNLDEPSQPLDPFLLCEEPTYEGLVKLLATGQPSLGLFSDEGGRMVGGHALGKENLLKTACGLSSLWDGKPLTRVRGGDENLLLYGRRVSLHLMTQEVVLNEILKNDLLLGQGLLARCLLVFPNSTAGQRKYNPKDISDDIRVKIYWKRISELLDRPRSLTDLEIENELSPRKLPLSTSAKELWILFHDETDQALKSDGEYWIIRRMGNKAPEQALRIAGIFTLIDNFDADEIPVSAMERAIELMKFYLAEALRISEIGFQDPALELARKTLEWMTKKDAEAGGQKIFTLKELYQRGGPRAIRKKDDALRIIHLLEEHGAVERTENENEWILSR